MKALTIRQPWASLIVEAGKDIENRSRATNVRGWVLVHAGLKNDDMEAFYFCKSRADRLPNFGLVADTLRSRVSSGGIIGAMHITDCVIESASPWFTGPFGWVIDRVVKLPFFPCKGAQGWFNVELPPAMEALIPPA